MQFFSESVTPSSYYLINTPRSASWLFTLLKGSKIFAFDIETSHPTCKNKELIRDYVKATEVHISGISFAWRDPISSGEAWVPGPAAYLPLRKNDDSPFWGDKQDRIVGLLKECLEADSSKVAHNAKFDVGTLARKLGILTKNVKFDTMLAHLLLDEDRVVSSHALKSDYNDQGVETKKGCAEAYLSIEGGKYKDTLKSAMKYYDPKYQRYSKVPLDVLYPYACADADMTISLAYIFKAMLENQGVVRLYQNLVMPLQHEIMRLELHGVPLHIEKAKSVVEEQTAIMKETQPIIWQLFGKEFLISSNKELGKLLFEELNIPGGVRNKDGWAVDSDVLKKIDHPAMPYLLQYRRAQKIESTYASAALELVSEVSEDGKIGWVHPTYWLDTTTGRLRCNDPNLTNLPKADKGGGIVKGMWECPDGYVFVFKDFSQIELKVIAHESQDPTWVDGFRNKHDMHSAMAHKIWKLPCSIAEVKSKFSKERSNAKTVNFGIAYGQGIGALSASLGITKEEAEKLVNVDYFGAAPVLKKWIDDTHAFAEQNGYVRNLFGRIRHLPEAMIDIPQGMYWPKDDVRPSCYRNCVNKTELGLQNTDVFSIAPEKLRQVIRARSTKKCSGCDCLWSCWVNSEIKFLKGCKGKALRQAVNSIIQGGAADMTSQALVWMSQEFKNNNLSANPVLYIHDEIGVFCKESDVEVVERIMEDCMVRRLVEYTNFSVPLETDTIVVKNWGDKHLKEK